MIQTCFDVCRLRMMCIAIDKNLVERSRGLTGAFCSFELSRRYDITETAFGGV
jgi:hypothetical protein